MTLPVSGLFRTSVTSVPEFSDFREEDLQDIWRAFLRYLDNNNFYDAVDGTTYTNPPETTEFDDLFDDFILNRLLRNAPPFYQDLIATYFPSASPAYSIPLLHEEAWQAFLDDEGLTENPLPGNAIVEGHFQAFFTSSLPTSGIYKEALTDAFGPLTPTTVLQHYWDGFLASINLSVTPPADTMIYNALVAYISTHHLSTQLEDAPTFYQQQLATYFPLSSSYSSTELRQIAWDQFLMNKGFQGSPAASDTSTQQDFLAFFTTDVPTEGLYRNTLTNAFGSSLVGVPLQQYWEGFLQSLNLAVTPPENSGVNNALISYINSSSSVLLTDAPSFYQQQLATYFPISQYYNATSIREKAWAAFLQYKGLTANPADGNTVLEQEFTAFFTSNVPTTGMYRNQLTAAFGSSLTSSALQVYWNNFLNSIGLTVTPPDDQTIETALVSYISANNPGLSKLFTDAPSFYQQQLAIYFPIPTIDPPPYDPSTIRQGAWELFLTSKGLIANPTESDTFLEADFEIFLTQQPSLSSGAYRDAIVNAFGAPSDSNDQAALNIYWREFLLSIGLTTNPPPDANISGTLNSYILLNNRTISPAFLSAFNTIFPGSNPPLVDPLWLDFLEAESLSTTPPGYSSYLTSWNDYLIYQAARIFPTDGNYANIFDSTMGSNFEPGLKQDIWESFLTLHNYAINPPIDDVAIQNLWSSFLSDRLLAAADARYLQRLNFLYETSLDDLQREELWQNFLVTFDYTTPPLYDTVVGDYLDFIHSRILPNPGIYHTAITNAFGAIVNDTDSLQIYWEDFLNSLNLPANAPPDITFLAALNSRIADKTITSPFKAIFTNIYSSALFPFTDSQIQAVWEAFLTTQNLQGTPPEDSSTTTLWIEYLETFANSMPLPTSGSYYDVIAAYTLNTSLRQAIWGAFLAYKNYPRNPPEENSPILQELEDFLAARSLSLSSSFHTAISTLYGTYTNLFINTSNQYEDIWQQYLISNNIAISPSDTPSEAATFSTYLRTAYPITISSDYATVIDSVFALGGLSTSERQALWEEFLLTKSSLSTPPDSTAIRSDLSSYITNISIVPSNTDPTGNSFNKILTAVFGSVLSNSHRLELWQQFLKAADYYPGRPPTTTDILAKFQAYIATTTLIEESYYDTRIREIYGSNKLNYAQRQLVWNDALKYLLLPANPPNNPYFRDSLTDFIVTVRGKTLPTGSSFATAITNAFGSTLTSSQKSTLWANFLTSRGYNYTPGDESDLPTNQQTITNDLISYITSTTLTAAGLGEFNNIMTNIWGSRITSAQKQVIWESFLAGRFPGNPPNDTSIKNLFSNYLVSTTFPIPSTYDEAITSVLGSPFAADLKQAIWDSFLEANNYPGNPPINDSSFTTGLTNFLQGRRLSAANTTFTAIIDTLFGSLLTSVQKEELWQSFLVEYGFTTNPTVSPSTTHSLSTFIARRTLPTSGVYRDTINSLFGSGYSEEALQTIWEGFLTSEGLPANPPTDPAFQTAFINYAISLVATGFYQDALNAFYVTASDKASAWVDFLQAYNPPRPVPDSFQGAFMQFIQGRIARANLSTVLSPNEVLKRNIMLLVFELAFKMLKALQNTVAVQAKNIVFLGKWQEEYTKQLTRTPVYVGQPTDTWTYHTDPEKFKLGYADISLADIGDYMAANPSSTYTYLLPTDSGSLKAHIKFNGPENKVELLVSDFSSTPTRFFTASTPVTSGSTPADISKNWTEAFDETFTDPRDQPNWGTNETLNIYQDSASKKLYIDVIDSTKTEYTVLRASHSHFTIPWRYVDTGGDNKAVQQLRTETNSLLQQFIENTRSKRQVLRDLASSMQTNLSQSKEAISQQANLLTSIIESLKSLIAAIYR